MQYLDLAISQTALLKLSGRRLLPIVAYCPIIIFYLGNLTLDRLNHELQSLGFRQTFVLISKYFS